MKITDSNGRAVPIGSSGANPQGNSGVRRSGSPVESGGTDRVQLSGMSALMAAAAADSPDHLAKLSSLTATVLSGTYHVDASLVSNSIIEASLQQGASYI